MNTKFKFIYLIPLLVLVFYLVSFCSCGKDNKENEPNNDTIPKTIEPFTSDVEFWLTDPYQNIFLQKQKIVLNFSSSSNLHPIISVEEKQTYQSVDGFGFALTGGSAMLINQLPSLTRQNLLKELFTNDSSNIGINYLRVSIGASDLDPTVFSYNDLPSGDTDKELKRFSISPDTYHLIPVLKSIVALNPKIKILGSPWSAPVWMKTNNNSVGGSLKPEYYDVYALYLVKYIQAMQEHGITIDAITPQNEPLHGGNNPSMVMTAAEQTLFIKKSLGPAFESAGIKTKIIIYDHNCDKPEYPISVLNDKEANKYIDGSAFHLYSGDITALSQVHNAFPEKNVYFTEQWVGGPQNFAGDFRWHVKNLIIGATRNWAKTVIEWNLASDPNYFPHTPGGCDRCLGALTIGNTVSRNVAYFIIAHASKFVDTGSVRIGSNNIGTLYNTAFKTPSGKKVLIILNDGTSSQTFNIHFNEMQVTTSLAAGAAGTYIW